MLPELQEEDWQDARMPAVFLGGHAWNGYGLDDWQP